MNVVNRVSAQSMQIHRSKHNHGIKKETLYGVPELASRAESASEVHRPTIIPGLEGKKIVGIAAAGNHSLFLGQRACETSLITGPREAHAKPKPFKVTLWPPPITSGWGPLSGRFIRSTQLGFRAHMATTRRAGALLYLPPKRAAPLQPVFAKGCVAGARVGVRSGGQDSQNSR
eukprot:6472346-Amphidinium_carterae.1